MIEKRSLEEFRATGLLTFINQFLHIFGWSIVFECDDNNIPHKMYPARCKYRGFSEATTKSSYIKLSKWMNDNADELLKESQD